ncbi:hypothetical protein WN943_019645 [Citrus x changshan-huyou]
MWRLQIKSRAEQVPDEGKDSINSASHHKCVSSECLGTSLGSRTQVGIPRHQSFSPSSPVHFKESSKAKVMNRNSRRLMIGSTAPTCTYNECRGCKYKCRAEQVPVEGNDPINSAYHYKCVCHR